MKKSEREFMLQDTLQVAACRRIFELFLFLLSFFLLFGCVDYRGQDLAFETPEALWYPRAISILPAEFTRI